MGDAALYYHRVPVPWAKARWEDIPKYLELIDDMRTWCYSNYGDQWGFDQHGFWFNTEADAHWFVLRWIDDSV